MIVADIVLFKSAVICQNPFKSAGNLTLPKNKHFIKK